MDGSRFDAWTRRRFGLASGGLTAALLGLAAIDEDAEAKKKRCKKLGKKCNKKKRKCCKKLKCQKIGGVGKKQCCKKTGESCTAEEDCCSSFCGDGECQPVFCKDIGLACDVDERCCSNNCAAFTCAPPV